MNRQSFFPSEKEWFKKSRNFILYTLPEKFYMFWGMRWAKKHVAIIFDGFDTRKKRLAPRQRFFLPHSPLFEHETVTLILERCSLMTSSVNRSTIWSDEVTFRHHGTQMVEKVTVIFSVNAVNKARTTQKTAFLDGLRHFCNMVRKVRHDWSHLTFFKGEQYLSDELVCLDNFFLQKSIMVLLVCKI